MESSFPPSLHCVAAKQQKNVEKYLYIKTTTIWKRWQFIYINFLRLSKCSSHWHDTLVCTSVYHKTRFSDINSDDIKLLFYVCVSLSLARILSFQCLMCTWSIWFHRLLYFTRFSSICLSCSSQSRSDFNLCKLNAFSIKIKTISIRSVCVCARLCIWICFLQLLPFLVQPRVQIDTDKSKSRLCRIRDEANK